jgi:hypothetical protein
VLGIIRELFVVKEQLLTGCKDKRGAAIYALQLSIDKVHGQLPKTGKITATGRHPKNSPFPFPLSS